MTTQLPLPEQKEPKAPDEKSGILIQAMIKISDPDSKEVYVEKRA